MIHVSLVRGINVGARNRIRMDRLRAVHETAGLLSPRTLLQSGNVAFDAGGTRNAIETAIASVLQEEMGVAIEILVRTAGELEAVLSANPLPDAASADPAHLLVMFLKRRVRVEDVAAVERLATGGELIRPGREALYLHYPPPAGIGRSKLTGAVIEKALGTIGTSRNWTTLTKLLALSKPEAAALG